MSVSPITTQNAKGNVANAQALAGAANASYVIDATADFELQLQIDVTMGATVSASNGLQVSVYRQFGTSPTDLDTVPVYQFVLGAGNAANAESVQSIALPTGHWSVNVKNLDGTNAITYTITSTVITGVG